MIHGVNYDRNKTSEGDVERLANKELIPRRPKLTAENSKTASSSDLMSLIQDQMGREFSVERLYLGIAAFFSIQGMNNTSEFFKTRASEEKKHAMDFYKFIVSQGITPNIPTSNNLSMPEINCIDCALDETLKHERQVSEYIAKAYKKSLEDVHGAAMGFLHKYLMEQAEEEEWAMDLILKWKMCDGNKVDFEAAMAS